MARFKFSLQAVLEQRGHIEKERQRALSVLLAELAGYEGEIKAMDDAVKASAEEMRAGGHLRGRIDLAYLAGHRRFVLATERKAGAVIEKMALVHRRIEEARGLLVEASKARKVVEKLRDRRLAQWRAELIRKEQMETDEVGSTLTLLHQRREAMELAETGGDA
jgi:flagellar protein FliJ